MTWAMGLFWGVFSWARGRILKRWPAFPDVLVAPVLWVSLEYGRANLPDIDFPWALLGSSQYLNLQLLQSADLFGVWTLSFLLVAANSAVAGLLPGEASKVRTPGFAGQAAAGGRGGAGDPGGLGLRRGQAQGTARGGENPGGGDTGKRRAGRQVGPGLQEGQLRPLLPISPGRPPRRPRTLSSGPRRRPRSSFRGSPATSARCPNWPGIPARPFSSAHRGEREGGGRSP